VISRTQMMPMILEKCPAFSSAWETYQESWGRDESGIYNDIAEFATFIVDAYERRDTEIVSAAFALLEEFLVNGDEEVRTVASVGFLEDVRNISSWRPFGSGPFVQCLGPQSKVAWAEIEETWRGKQSLADVVRSEIRSQEKK
jgi:hypothetical protein